ncbi:Predicted lysozyme (DUF847) [Bergeriella denitrificans]|uniref:Predicted lysozyme (DUF847) n=1 Tax=Bergeriella denitrificans TaxID=494 RepID=A0A378UDU6_BERDE|nr:Predicted lysozyme (DUF847) [Bergeriella denitrificans]
MSFEQFIDRVLAHEGGYVNHPRDPGGETNWGITRRTAQANGYTGAMREMTRVQAVAIYRRAFWLRYGLDKMPPAVAYQVFDAAVNHGWGNAARFLQRALDVADDGRVGPVTLAALAKADAADVVYRFLAERLVFYTKLSTYPTFGRGWLRRVAHNLCYAAVDTGHPRALDVAESIERFVQSNKQFGAQQVAGARSYVARLHGLTGGAANGIA